MRLETVRLLRARVWVGVGAVLTLAALLAWAYALGDDADAVSNGNGSVTAGTFVPSTAGPPGDLPTPEPSFHVPSVPGRDLLEPPPATGDADEYASAVAEVMLGMDQRNHAPADYWDWLRAARDPQATQVIPAMTQESFDDAIAQRIPTDAMWQQMQDSKQWAAFSVENVWEPQYIRDKYATGSAPPGALMRNVAGTQTLHFVDENGEQAQRLQTRTISVLMACAPVYDECRLLAVSAGVVQ